MRTQLIPAELYSPALVACWTPLDQGPIALVLSESDGDIEASFLSNLGG